MLVLTRNPYEDIIIGDNIVVRYLGISGGSQIKIGIVAPDDVRILRREVAERNNIDVPSFSGAAAKRSGNI